MELVFHPDELLSKLKSHRGRIYIVAAGEIGKQIGVFLNQNDVNWTGFIDKNIDVIIGNKGVVIILTSLYGTNPSDIALAVL